MAQEVTRSGKFPSLPEARAPSERTGNRTQSHAASHWQHCAPPGTQSGTDYGEAGIPRGKQGSGPDPVAFGESISGAATSSRSRSASERRALCMMPASGITLTQIRLYEHKDRERGSVSQSRIAGRHGETDLIAGAAKHARAGSFPAGRSLTPALASADFAPSGLSRGRSFP